MSEFEEFTDYNYLTGQLGGVSVWYLPMMADLMDQNPEVGFIPGSHDNQTHYVDVSGEPHVLVERPDMPLSIDKTTIIADGVDFLTISGIPAGARIYIDRMIDAIATGEDVEITLDTEGVYKLRIELFPYKLIREIINGTAT
jgi:hypothetical protein